MTKNEDLKAFVINDNGDYEWIARSETPNIDVPIAEICELLNTLSDILSPANKVYDGKYFSDKHCVSRDVIDFIDRLPANGFRITRANVTPTKCEGRNACGGCYPGMCLEREASSPTDGAAERALDLMRTRCYSHAKISNSPKDMRDWIDADYKKILTALQSTRKPRTVKICIPETVDDIGEWADEVPVDTIAVPREVLQGVRDSYAQGIKVVKAFQKQQGHGMGDMCWLPHAENMLDSLDAVLAEGE